MGDAGAIRAAARIADPRGLTRAMGLGVEFSQAFAVAPQRAQKLRQTFDRSFIDRHMDIRKLGRRADQSLHKVERIGDAGMKLRAYGYSQSQPTTQH